MNEKLKEIELIEFLIKRLSDEFSNKDTNESFNDEHYLEKHEMIKINLRNLHVFNIKSVYYCKKLVMLLNVIDTLIWDSAFLDVEREYHTFPDSCRRIIKLLEECHELKNNELLNIFDEKQ